MSESNGTKLPPIAGTESKMSPEVPHPLASVRSERMEQIRRELSAGFESCGVPLDVTTNDSNGAGIESSDGAKGTRSGKAQRRRSFGDGAYLVPHNRSTDAYDHRGGFRPKSAVVDRTAVGHMLIKREFTDATSIGAKSQDYIYDRAGRLQAVIVKGPPVVDIDAAKSIAAPDIVQAKSSAELLQALHLQRSRSSRRERAVRASMDSPNYIPTTKAGACVVGNSLAGDSSKSPSIKKQMSSSIMSRNASTKSGFGGSTKSAAFGGASSVATAVASRSGSKEVEASGSIAGVSFGSAKTGRALVSSPSAKGSRIVLNDHMEFKDRQYVVRKLV